MFCTCPWSSCSRRAEKYFKRAARLDWPDGATSRESMRAVWKLPRLPVISQNLQLQNCLYKIGVYKYVGK
jgi:dual-specificity kinase